MTELVLDALLLAMLVTTVLWCVVLHRRLGRVARGRGELAALVDALTAGAERAETAARELRAAASEACSVQERQDREAEENVGELGRLLGTASRVIQRLESGLAGGLTQLAQERTRADLERRPPAARQAAGDATVASRPRRKAKPTGIAA